MKKFLLVILGLFILGGGLLFRYYRTIFLEPLVLPEISEDYFIVESIDYELTPEQDGFLDFFPLTYNNIVSPYEIHSPSRKYVRGESEKWFINDNIFQESGHVSVSQIKQLLENSRIYIEQIDQEINQELLQKKILKIKEDKIFQHETPGEVLPTSVQSGIRDSIRILGDMSIYHCLNDNKEESFQYMALTKTITDLYFPKAGQLISNLVGLVLYKQYLQTISLNLELCNFGLEELQKLKADIEKEIPIEKLILDMKKQEYRLAKKALKAMAGEVVEKQKIKFLWYDEKESQTILKYLYKKRIDEGIIDLGKFENGSYWFEGKFEKTLTIIPENLIIPYRKNIVGRYMVPNAMIPKLMTYNKRLQETEVYRKEITEEINQKIYSISGRY